MLADEFAVPKEILDPSLRPPDDADAFKPAEKKLVLELADEPAPAKSGRRQRRVKLPDSRTVGERLRRQGGIVAMTLMIILRSLGTSVIAHAILLIFFLLFTVGEIREPSVPPLTLETLHSDSFLPQPDEVSLDPSDFELDAMEESVEMPSIDEPAVDDAIIESDEEPEPIVLPQMATSPDSTLRLPTNLDLGGFDTIVKSKEYRRGVVEPVTAAGKTGDFENRGGQNREQAAEDFGGGKAAVHSVDLALAWLARHQRSNGSWNPDGERYSKSMPTLNNPSLAEGFDVGVTSLALLAFMGAGHSEDSDTEYSDNVRKGLRWLVGKQDSRGRFIDKTDEHSADSFAYNSAVATLAMAEATILHEDDRKYRKALKKALKFWESCQNESGGWSYYSGQTYSKYKGYRIDARSDTSITGWVVLAFDTAKEAGLEINEEVWDRSARLFKEFQRGDTGETRYADSYPYPNRYGPGMAGVGLTARRILKPRFFADYDRLAVKYLMKEIPSWDKLRESNFQDNPQHHNTTTIYGWYASTLGMFYATGGKGAEWKRWNDALKGSLLPNQRTDGPDRGSWDPVQVWIGNLMGRVYSTATAALTLEVYYRHKPTRERMVFRSAADEEPVPQEEASKPKEKATSSSSE